MARAPYWMWPDAALMMVRKSGLREAPPTRKPSMSFSDARAAAEAPLTDPPYLEGEVP